MFPVLGQRAVFLHVWYTVVLFWYLCFGASGWNEQTTEIWIMQISFYPNSFYTLCKSIQILSSCEQQLEDGGNPVVCIHQQLRSSITHTDTHSAQQHLSHSPHVVFEFLLLWSFQASLLQSRSQSSNCVCLQAVFAWNSVLMCYCKKWLYYSV